MSIAATLGRFAATTPAAELPEVAIERARMSLASTVASAAMGWNIRSARVIRDLEIEAAGRPDASVWFANDRLPVDRAARVNAMASDAAASDDSDLRSIAHIGTIVSTVSIALAERLGSSGRDVFAAMVLGYEIAGRIDEALTPGRMQRGLHGSVSTIFGGAVAAGRLLGLSAAQMTQAIAIAATSAGGLAVAADTSCAREYHAGLSAMLGTQAALAASRGFEAEPAALEGPRGFFGAFNGQALEDVTRDLGASWDIVTDMAIKLMPGAHPFHAIAEAAAGAAIDGDVVPGEVHRVVVSAIQLQPWRDQAVLPYDLIGAAHSVAYFVAAAVVDRHFGWNHFEVAKMRDPAISSMLQRVEFDPDPPPLPDRFPHRHGGTVTIELLDGRVLRRTCTAPRGSGPRGVEWADVEAKFRRLAPLSGLDAARVEGALHAIRTMEGARAAHDLIGHLRPDPGSRSPGAELRA
jgi:2-methylcitrate dehydratase PrpD